MGTGAPKFEPALLLLCQERAEQGLCVCMTRLHEAPAAFMRGRRTCLSPLGRKGQTMGRKGGGILWSPEWDKLSDSLQSSTQHLPAA